MPVIEFSKNDFLTLLGKELSDDEIKSIMSNVKSEAEIDGNVIRCEITPDRADLLSVEGMAKAVKLNLGLKPRNVPIHDSRLTVKGSSKVRPYFVCATLENVKLTDELVASLMQIQEKIHATIGRDRKKVAIGVHDLDKIKPPITYEDINPDDIKFVPLMKEEPMTLNDILTRHEKGKDYAHLLKGFDSYPVFLDKEGVMSFPPIINSERTKVSETTKNLFLDITGTDEKAVEQVLNIFLSNISERCGSIGTVKVGRTTYPRFIEEKYKLDPETVNKILGLQLTDKEIIECLDKFGYQTKKRGKDLDITVPYYRSDILHEIDIIEDIAIGYGYNNIVPEVPKLFTIGGLSETTIFSRKLRETMIGLNFQEVSSFVLTNQRDNSDNMLIKSDAVDILNPVSAEYTICRTWLTPSLLKILSNNLHVEYPQRIFEIGDVIAIDPTQETSTKTMKKLAGAVSHDTANLTEMRSFVESILKYIGVKYEIKSMKHDSFIATRVGEIIVNGKTIGFFGEISPKVIENFGLERPVIIFEIDIEGLYG